jgi:hypothetical protein
MVVLNTLGYSPAYHVFHVSRIMGREEICGKWEFLKSIWVGHTDSLLVHGLVDSRNHSLGADTAESQCSCHVT